MRCAHHGVVNLPHYKALLWDNLHLARGLRARNKLQCYKPGPPALRRHVNPPTGKAGSPLLTSGGNKIVLKGLRFHKMITRGSAIISGLDASGRLTAHWVILANVQKS
eukprot:GEMP01050692.1.p3 GENE.GEMP01050692.1~~GEMP01050692.1.p3  ORF type:complete len:108 (-),score=7.18 GEMP01050692.1:47-370(-)